jgi:Pentapeptide repeats (9 copies)/Pentapeptide repeats (8 copies)
MSDIANVEDIIYRYSEGDRDFSGLNFSKQKIINYNFSNCDFSNTIFSKANLTSSAFVECTFENANFAQAKLEKVRLESSSFHRCMMKNIRAIGSNIHFCDFADSNLSHAKFTGSWIGETSFDRADLSYADYSFVHDPDGIVYEEGICHETVMPDLRIRTDLSTSDKDYSVFNRIKFTSKDINDEELIQVHQSIYELFIQDNRMCGFFLKENPFSLEQMILTLLHVNDLGYWETSEKNIEHLQELSERVKINEWMA